MYNKPTYNIHIITDYHYYESANYNVLKEFSIILTYTKYKGNYIKETLYINIYVEKVLYKS